MGRERVGRAWRFGALAVLVLFAMAGTVRAAKPSFTELVASLKSPNAKTRQEAAAALGKSRRREAVAPLSALVRDPDAKVRMQVVRSLDELRDLSAAPALCISLQDGDSKIREEAVSALVELYADKERTSPVDRFLNLFSDEYDRASVPLFTGVDPQVFTALAGVLRNDEDKNLRMEAALALGILDGRSAVKELVAALQDPEADVRGAAATAVGKVGTEADGRALIPLLSDESMNVRNRVLQAIGVLRVKEAGPALRELYDANQRREFGLRVLACLSKIGDPNQADLFKELLQDPDPEKKRLGIEGLARVSNALMLPAFEKDFQREGNEQVKLAYCFAISSLGNRAFLDSIVLSLPSRTVGRQARGYLLEEGPPILPDLYPYLNDPEAEVRAALCEIIGIIGDASSIPKLTPLVSDPNPKVSDRATQAIAMLQKAGSTLSR